jgi:hypothetical protein
MSGSLYYYSKYLSHVWRKLKPKPMPGGTCYQLMEAIDPGATKINFVIVFHA